MEAVKRIRKDFTNEELKVLEEAWDSGMVVTGKKKKDKIDEVASRLNMSADRVKAWIGNRRIRQKGQQTQTLRRPSVTNLQGPNAYSLFISSQKRGDMDGKQFLTNTAKSWRLLPENNKKEFQFKAAELRKNPLGSQPREAVIQRQLKIIGEACEILEDVGFEVGGLGFDRKSECKPALFGTDKSVEYLNKISCDYELQLSAPSTVIPSHSGIRKNLRKDVGKKFQSCWETATGSSGKLPYKSVKNGSVILKVTGLPKGNSIKKPSTYGIAEMREILKATLTFQVSYPASSETRCENEMEIVSLLPDSSNSSSEETVESLPVIPDESNSSSEETVESLPVIPDGSNSSSEETVESLPVISDGSIPQIETEDLDTVPEILLDMFSSNCTDSLVCEEVYTISYLKEERITKRNKKQYFVVWEGYPEEQGTWEYAANIPLHFRKTFKNLLKAKTPKIQNC